MTVPQPSTGPYISIVVPLYNEEENVQPLYSEIREVVDRAGYDAELVFVDDGSSDRTIQNLLEAAAGDSTVKVVEFRRNFGQTAAMAAGLDQASGGIVVTMDGDLQNDPREIPKMVSKLEEGFDLVAGWRKDRKDKFLSRRLPSILANKIISKTTSVELHDYGCTLKVMRSEVAKNVRLYGEMHRFIPAIAAQLGAKIAEVPVNHRPRIHGTSKYGISRTFRVVLDLLTVKFFSKFLTKPLHLFGGFATASFGLSFLGFLFLAYDKLIMLEPIGGRPLLLISVLLFLVGLQLLCVGLLAEVIVRVYHESQDKKTYAVRSVLTPRLEKAANS